MSALEKMPEAVALELWRIIDEWSERLEREAEALKRLEEELLKEKRVPR